MDASDVYIVQRQVLGSVLGGVGSIISGVGSGINSAVSGVGVGVTSGLGDVTSAILPSSTTPTTTSTSPSSTPVTSTSITSPSSSSSITTFTTLTSTSTSSTTTSTSRPTLSSDVPSSSSTQSTPSSTITPSSSPFVYTSTSDGVQETITAFVTPSSSPNPSQSPTSNYNGFLNNKPLEGFVFALCGIIGIIILFLVTTFALRRSRRKRMINEALSYEPTTTHGYTGDIGRNLNEKIRESYTSSESSGTGLGPPNGPVADGGYYSTPGIGQQGARGYEHDYPAYTVRSPNTAYDATHPYGPSYGYDVSQASQGVPVVASYIHPAGVSQHASTQPGLALLPAMTPNSAANV